MKAFIRSHSLFLALIATLGCGQHSLRAAGLDQQWDGDNGFGNFSFNDNWYSNSQPSWSFGGNLNFNFRNAGATSLYYDYGSWVQTNDIKFMSGFNGAVVWDGDGNGIDFNQRLENHSSFTQTIGTMNLSGAKNGATQIELNPVNGDLVLNGNLYNDNSKPYYVYGNNGKTLTVNSSLGVGSTASNVSFNVVQNSNIIFTANQTYAGGTVISAGTLTVGNGGSTGSLGTGSITNNGSLIFNRSGNVAVADTISGSGSLSQNGTNILSLTTANSYSGATTVNSGTLRVTANDALGTNASGTTVNSGGAVRLFNVNYTTAEALTINGTGVSGTGALYNIGTSTYAGAITAASHSTLRSDGSLTLTGGIVKNGTTLTIAGTGSVIINTVGISGAAANSDLIVDSSTLVVNAPSTYVGPTTVQNGGTLVANNSTGSATGNGNVTINSDSTLSGTGTILGGTNLITINGALIVGDSTIGSPTASVLELNTSGAGSTAIGSTAKIYIDLFSGPTTDNSANASAADMLRLFGTVDFTSGGEFHVDNPNGLTGWAAGAKWKVLDPTGANLTGDVPTFFLPTLTGGLAWDTSSLGNTGILAIIAIPEPSRALLLMVGLIVAGFRRRRSIA